jgi:hypothetical protein
MVRFPAQLAKARRCLSEGTAVSICVQASKLAAMRLQPYERVDATPFTLRSDELLRTRGQPWRAVRNDVGLDEMDYGDVVYRFQEGGRLEEITFQAKVITLGNVAVPFATLAAFVRAQDPEAFERAGFVVSPRFGLAFDPREPFWVTALARHCIPEWKAL